MFTSKCKVTKKSQLRWLFQTKKIWMQKKKKKKKVKHKKCRQIAFKIHERKLRYMVVVYLSCLFIQKPVENIWSRGRKSSEIGEDQKTLIPALAYFLIAIGKVLFLERRLSTVLYPQLNLRFFKISNFLGREASCTYCFYARYNMCYNLVKLQNIMARFVDGGIKNKNGTNKDKTFLIRAN